MVDDSGQRTLLTWLAGAVALVGLFWFAPAWLTPFLVGLSVLAVAREATRKLHAGQPRPIRHGISVVGVLLALASGLAWPTSPTLAVAILAILAVAILAGRRGLLAQAGARTGMLAPAIFVERAEEELSRGLRFGRPAAVLVVSLNETGDMRREYGRRAASGALKRIGDVLIAQSRSYDLLARLDGGRFATMLPETTHEEALAAAMRIREAVALLRFAPPGEETALPLSVSVGVAVHPQDGDTIRQLLSGATSKLGRPGAAAATMAQTEGRAREAGEARPADDAPQTAAPAPTRLAAWVVPVYIWLVSVGATLLFALTFQPIPRSAWGLLLALGIVGIAARQLRINLFGGASASTGIIPIIAGGILFGPTAAIALGMFAGLAVRPWKGKVNRRIFDAGLYSLVAGSLALCQPLLDNVLRDTSMFHLALVGQGLILGFICYVLNSALLVVVMALSEANNPISIWRERFIWLLPHTLVCGVLAAFMALAGSGLGPIGPLIFAVPALMLQLVTKQYTDRTRESVLALREAHTQLAATNDELLQSAAALEHSYTTTLSAFSGMLDARDSETEGHSQRVVAHAVAIGKALKLGQREMDALEVGALLHDIGKVGVADAILRKNGPLTPDEWDEMRRHPEIGWGLTAKIPFLHDASLLVRHHHERWDGNGYPDRLCGDAIPLIARVFSVADSFDAMISDRPYRRGMPLEAALAELRRGAGIQFDPQVVAAFLQLAADPEYLNTIRQVVIDNDDHSYRILMHSH